MKQRKENALILCPFAFGERTEGSPGFLRVSGLTMRTHDAAPSGDSVIQQRLHNLSLIDSLRQPHTVALPVTPCPSRLDGKSQARNVLEQRVIVLCLLATGGDDFG